MLNWNESTAGLVGQNFRCFYLRHAIGPACSTFAQHHHGRTSCAVVARRMVPNGPAASELLSSDSPIHYSRGSQKEMKWVVSLIDLLARVC